MFRPSLLIAALALAACTPKAHAPAGPETASPTAATTPAGANLCVSHAQKTWTANHQTFQVEASTAGATCAQATATLIVHGANNTELLRFTSPTEQIFDLRDATDVEAMDTALATWIDQSRSNLATAAALPDWPQGAAQPGGEFAFYPEEGVTRDQYLSTRAAGKPMFCFTQGLESLACYVLDNGELEKLGVQTFPG